MSWPVVFDSARVSLHVEGRITPEDAARQETTAKEILKRLKHQPGLILADEVGLGKTFVALGVAHLIRLGRQTKTPGGSHGPAITPRKVAS